MSETEFTPLEKIKVKVRGRKIKTGWRILFPREYVVQENWQAERLARQEGIIPTRVYGHKPTSKSLDPRLEPLYEDRHGRVGTEKYLRDRALEDRADFLLDPR